MTDIKIENTELQRIECACDICQAMCRRRPCWGSVDDIAKIIEAGYSSRLMLDYWVGTDEIPEHLVEEGDTEISMLCGSIPPYEGRNAPWIVTGRCTFFNNNNMGLCEIHDIKPSEGAIVSHHFAPPEGYRIGLVIDWAGRRGRSLVALWGTWAVVETKRAGRYYKTGFPGKCQLTWNESLGVWRQINI